MRYIFEYIFIMIFIYIISPFISFIFVFNKEGLRASLIHVTANPSVLTDVYTHYSARTNLAISRLEAISAKYFAGFVMAQPPQSTFYVFANFSPLLANSSIIRTDIDLIKYFRDMCNKGSTTTGVACVPGSAFGLQPEDLFVRFSCAVDLDALNSAFDIIDEAMGMIVSK